MKKNKVAYKLSDASKIFLRKLNENAYKAGHIPYGDISLDDLLMSIYYYFKLNNDRYLELLEIVGKMKEQKNVS